MPSGSQGRRLIKRRLGIANSNTRATQHQKQYSLHLANASNRHRQTDDGQLCASVARSVFDHSEGSSAMHRKILRIRSA